MLPDRRVYGIHGIVDRLIDRLHGFVHIHGAMQFLCLFRAGKGGQFPNEFPAFLLRDKPGGFHSIYQQFQFRQFK